MISDAIAFYCYDPNGYESVAGPARGITYVSTEHPNFESGYTFDLPAINSHYTSISTSNNDVRSPFVFLVADVKITMVYYPLCLDGSTLVTMADKT